MGKQTSSKKKREPVKTISPGRRWLFKFLALLLGLLLAFGFLEGFLRWNNPFSLRVKNGRIQLPVNARYKIKNKKIERIDRVIIHTKNSLGFRGSEPPRDFDEQLTIITVGGSTTECFYLSDEKTWPEQLRTGLNDRFSKVWLNNAGLDGHSIYGHRDLLNNYLAPLRPKVIVYLIGLNDVGYDDGNLFDIQLFHNPNSNRGLGQKIYVSLVETYAVFNAYDNWSRYRRAKKMGLVHLDLNHQQLKLSESQQPKLSQEKIFETLLEHQNRFLSSYQKQVITLVHETKDYGIVPVLVTQPALYGDAIDDVTKVDLGKMAVGDLNGNVKWQILELYNDITREVAQQENVALVDLAQSMPKSSRYFYDHHHFTNEGAQKVGQIVAGQLQKMLSRHFPEYVLQDPSTAAVEPPLDQP